MKLAVVVLSYKRTKNLKKIISAINKSTVRPDNIYIFNNNPEIRLEINGVTIINSGENFRCKARHSFGLMTDSTHFLFQDDDLMLLPTTIASFIKWRIKYPDSILGLFGRKVNLDGLYDQAEVSHISVQEPKEVDLVLGRVHFCRKGLLAQPFLTGKDMSEDDIALSLANIQVGNKNYVIPSVGFIGLPMYGVGICNRDHHLDFRNKAVKEWLT